MVLKLNTEVVCLQNGYPWPGMIPALGLTAKYEINLIGFLMCIEEKFVGTIVRKTKI